MPVTKEQIQQALEKKRGVNRQQVEAEIQRRQAAPAPQVSEAPAVSAMSQIIDKAAGDVVGRQRRIEQRAPLVARIAQEKAAEEAAGRAKDQRTVDRLHGIARFVGEEGPQMVGAIGGAIAGGPGGAAIGGGLGRGVTELVKKGMGQETDIAQSIKRAATEELLFESGGLAIAKTGKFIFSPFIKRISPKVSAMADAFRQLGGKFSPATLNEAPILKFLEAASRNSIQGKEILEKFIDEPGQNALKRFSRVIAGNLAEGVSKLEPDVMANTLLDVIKGADNTFDEVFGPSWAQLDELTKGARVSTAGLKDFAEEQIFKISGIEALAGTPELERIVNAIDKLGPEVTFEQMRAIKAGLAKKIKSLTISGDAADGAVKKLVGLANEAMLDPKSVRGAGKEARMLHANLKKAYSSGKEAFTTAFPDKLIAALDDPLRKSAAVEKLFPNQGIDNIRNMRGALTKTLKGTTSPEGVKTWNSLQRLWFENLIEKSVDQTGFISSKALEKNVRAFGPKAVKELLGSEQARSLRLLRGMADKSVAKKGKLMFLVRSLQIGGGVAALGGAPGDEPTSVRVIGGTVALTPVAYAILASSRGGSALLRATLTLPKGSKRLPGMVIKLGAALRREKKRLAEKPIQQTKKQRIESLRQKAIELGARDE